jgi:hypothetical protein
MTVMRLKLILKVLVRYGTGLKVKQQIKRLEARLIALRAISDRYSWLRLAVMLVGAIILFPLTIFTTVPIAIVWTIFVVGLFALVVAYHRRVLETIRQFEIWQRLKELHIAQVALDWESLPESSYRPDPEHPFENDFDVTGRYSLHRVMDTTTTNDAAAKLREWLLITEPDLDATLKRQALVRELQRIPVYRDKLTLYATRRARRLGRKRDVSRLLNWLAAQSTDTDFAPLLRIAVGFVFVNLTLFILDQVDVIPPLWQITMFLYIGFIFSRFEIRGFFGDALAMRSLITPLKDVFDHIEHYPYAHSPDVRSLCQPFLDSDESPSRVLRRVNRILGAAGMQQNPIAWFIINMIVPWDLYFAGQLQEIKKVLKEQLPVWLETWIELEALSALATFADLNQDHMTYPEFLPVSTTPIFEATAMGHPLIPAERRVCNSMTIENKGDIALLTGSNMSGKSTFLRTIGLNLSLTLAGAPVIANEFKTVPFRQYACIRVTDSVTDGISYFYAEVRRLKGLLNELQSDSEYPLLFLIDEIFRGTNNRERLVGSRSYIRSLVGTNGTGIIATHDLELVQLGDEFEKIDNYHFRDDVREGKMIFDYKLHEGPSPTTNALKIMEMEGLPVDH